MRRLPRRCNATNEGPQQPYHFTHAVAQVASLQVQRKLERRSKRDDWAERLEAAACEEVCGRALKERSDGMLVCHAAPLNTVLASRNVTP